MTSITRKVILSSYFILVLPLLIGCETSSGDCDPDSVTSADIIAIGDSILQCNCESEQSIPDYIGTESNLPISNNSISGSEIQAGLTNIPSQYFQNTWN